MRRQHKSVLVIGSGITGLMTAYYASLSYDSVSLISKSKDPRNASPETHFDSSTWDGGVNRYITLTEGHPYLNLPGYINITYPNIDADFRKEISVGGMLSKPIEQWNGMASQFLQSRILANQDQQSALELFDEYLDENRASMEHWYMLLTDVIKKHPHILPLISLHSNGIDRFYDKISLFRDALSAQTKQNIVKESFSSNQLLEHSDFQIYKKGIQNQRFIAGGGLTMYGLAFDIQAFSKEWLFKELENQGVDMRLGDEYEVTSLERNSKNQIQGLRLKNGDFHTAKHIFIHSGAYMDPKVLKDTDAYGKLAGVRGFWMRIKRAERFLGKVPRPNKIHGGKYKIKSAKKIYTGQICDLNVMPKLNANESWDLIIGSGYLFAGIHPFEDETKSKELIIHAFAQIVSHVYDINIDIDAVIAGTHKDIDLPSKGCVRSWTPDDRELRVLIPTTHGGITIIDGGGNTGSTTKSPFISKTAILFSQSLDELSEKTGSLELNELQKNYEKIRASLRRTKEEITLSDWVRMENSLNQVVNLAKGL